MDIEPYGRRRLEFSACLSFQLSGKFNRLIQGIRDFQVLPLCVGFRYHNV